jgi:large conductance mechanosensitive channel
MALPLENVTRRLPRKPGWLGDFQAFIMRGNVVDLAVGIIIGAAFTSIVQSLVKDIFNPVIGLLTGGVDFSDLFFVIKGPHAPTLAAAKALGAVTINYGLFINAVIQFVIVAFVVFWLVRAMSRFVRKAEEAPAAPTATEVLLGQIRDLLQAQHNAQSGQGTLPLHPGGLP